MGSRVNLKMNIVLFLIRQNVSMRVLIFSNNVGFPEANRWFLTRRQRLDAYQLEHALEDR